MRHWPASLSRVAGAILLCVAAGLTAVPWRIVPEDGITPVAVSVAPAGATLRVPFNVRWDEHHDIALVFPERTGDAAFEARIGLAMDMFASGPRPAFDLEWTVFQGPATVAKGDGQASAQGAVREPDGDRKLLFGSFPARSGRDYVLEVRFGADLAPTLRHASAVEVRTANTARISHLRTRRQLHAVAAAVAVLLGAGLLATALRAARRDRPR